MTAFRDFLEGQREARQLSVPEFADFLGISYTSLRNFIRKENPKAPGRNMLLKIAQATNVPLTTLVEYLDPEAAARINQLSGRIQFFAELVDGLSEEQAEVVFTLIETMRRQNERGQ
jgi:transcriptional regulator with XRE-family HTH domain